MISTSTDPTQGEFQFINGLAVTIYGQGEPVVMSAGLGGLGSYWRPQLKALGDYQVILYDHRGTGDSARDLPDDYSARDLADDLRRVIDGLDLESAHVVGHAAGGVAGLELARTAPDKVKSLTVVNGWAKADTWFKRCFEIRTGRLRYFRFLKRNRLSCPGGRQSRRHAGAGALFAGFGRQPAVRTSGGAAMGRPCLQRHRAGRLQRSSAQFSQRVIGYGYRRLHSHRQ
ncbi:MAG: alpha/beta fold hydrolase [Asticcacaulis sp.]|nr:alpha/beta fold hydrolase [Asticcacaulis sp.]